MIFVDMKGNLGNQMFIYALARRIQEQTGQCITLNTYFLEKNYPDYVFSLGIFKLCHNVSISSEKFPSYASTESLFYKIIKKTKLFFLQKLIFNCMKKRNVFIWDSTEYIQVEPNMLRLKKKKDIYLSGFWQSPRYFDSIRKCLLNDFVLKSDLNKEFYLLFNSIQSSNSICVSIRRGDYISDPANKKKHYVCDDKYFFDAFDWIKDNIKNPNIICFSDDISWAKMNLKIDLPILFEPEGTTLTDKIILMKSCKNFVLSNSSFSWWVEYLCNNDSKIVLAPNKWYANGLKADVFEPYWILLSV